MQQAERKPTAMDTGAKKQLKKVKRTLFPFTAMVGQKMMKHSLILNAIDPLIGGVLIEGQKGTGKSISVRGLSEILPPLDTVESCRFSCNPKEPEKWCWECRERFGELEDLAQVPVSTRAIRVVDLPLNATEDRVVGTINIEKILTEGLKAFEHGVMAEANRGILYIDEINLLDDYIVDVLLDAAAMGVATVERESVSVSYPARFIIVGSMNPEEGNLRPQLLDRIALTVKIKGIDNVQERIEVMRRQKEFVIDPDAFRATFEADQDVLRAKIEAARTLLKEVKVAPKLLETIAKVSLAFGVDGHRADIIMERTARANAAYDGRTHVEVGDIVQAAELALPHRMRRKPFEEEEFSTERLRRVVEESV
jgi:magnesium chelatase subunit I